MITDYIRKRITELRKQKGLTQEAFAERLGMCTRKYKRFEGGQKKIVDPDLLEHIAEALDVSLLELLPLEKLGPGDSLKNVDRVRDEQRNLQSIADEIRAHYDAIIRQQHSILEEEKRLSSEKDNILREQRTQLAELRKIIEELKHNSRK